jgi:diguanylate cyclase (GGDEF)-like protein/PAS domain S-box-containing protein
MPKKYQYNSAVTGNREIPMPKILVVDELEANGMVLRRLQKKLNCQIIETNSGNNALSLCQDHEFSLIMLDVNIPEMDAYEVADILGSVEKVGQVPLMFLNVEPGTKIHKLKTYDTDELDLLYLPIDSNLLLSKVKLFLKLNRQRVELQAARSKIDDLGKSNRLILDTATEAILVFDEDQVINLTNPTADRILQAENESVVGQQLPTIFDDGVNPENRLPWEQTSTALSIQDGKSFRDTDSVLYRSDGSCFPAELAFAPSQNSDSTQSGGVIVFQDITEKKLTECEMTRLAQEDPLTRLPNREMFNELLENSLTQCKRHNESLLLFYLDLDHFKQINDNLGYEAGDKLLVEIARRLQQFVRKTDMIARLGGDEFAVLMPNRCELSEASRIAEELIRLLEVPNLLDNVLDTTSFSIGIVTYPEAGNTSEQLLKAADTAMHHAKTQGRNNFQFYEPNMQRMSVQRSILRHELKLAVRYSEFTCHFQPQVRADNGEPIGLEALVRWNSPNRGWVQPDDFIPMAEESGLILPIGEQVLRNACDNFIQWKKQGLITGEKRVAVNISNHQLRRGNLIKTVTEILFETGMEPCELELEITESIVMDNPKAAIEILNELRALGVHIAVDDFGTGYSSLMYLKKLPLSSLKIDRGFVADIGRDKNDETIVIATINLAHSLGLTVTAEGIETAEQAEFLRAHECDNLQGYYFSRPLPVDEITDWLQAEFTFSSQMERMMS